MSPNPQTAQQKNQADVRAQSKPGQQQKPGQQDARQPSSFRPEEEDEEGGSNRTKTMNNR